MKELIITLIISISLIAALLYCLVAFIVLDWNYANWDLNPNQAIRFFYVLLLIVASYIIFNRLTNGNKG